MKLTKILQPAVSLGWSALHPGLALKQLIAKLDLVDPDGWGSITGATYTGKSVGASTIFQLTATFSAIRLISETIGILPLHVYERTDAGRTRAVDHPLYWRLHDDPHPLMTPIEWKESLAVSLCAFGQTYLKRDDLAGEVRSLTPLPRAWCRPELVNGRPEYRVTYDGKSSPVPAEEIVPIRGFGGAGELEGYAPHQLHRQSIALTAAAEEYGARYFGSGARPSGVLMYDKVLKKEQREQIREEFEVLHAGLEKSNRLAVLEAGMKYQQVSSGAGDAQLIDLRKQQVAEVARVWRVPLHMLMEMDRATYNNSEAENRHFLTYTLEPYLQRIEQALNKYLLPRAERKRYYIEFGRDALLQGDSKTRAEFYRIMRTVGGITINEIRDRENLPRVEGGDDLHVPLNMAPLDALREILTDNSSDTHTGDTDSGTN